MTSFNEGAKAKSNFVQFIFFNFFLLNHRLLLNAKNKSSTCFLSSITYAKEARSSSNLRIILLYPLAGLFEYLFMFSASQADPKFKTVPNSTKE